MKIPRSIRNSYSFFKELYLPLKDSVDDFIISKIKKDSWHYCSRIKSEESYAQKLDLGLFNLDSNNNFYIDDFLGATIVVENLSGISEACKLIEQANESFKISYKRPKSTEITMKNSSDFCFDELRLYLEWKEPEYSKRQKLNHLIFELQIKTFLQHAWSIATHDLTYKTNNLDWNKERIAFQIKGMLEHADLSILEAENLANSSFLAKKHNFTEKKKTIIKFFESNFEGELLPNDLNRLAESIAKVLRLSNLKWNILKPILQKELDKNVDVLTNTSPMGYVIQAIINHIPEKFEEFLKKFIEKYDKKYTIPQEITLPSSLDLNLVVIIKG